MWMVDFFEWIIVKPVDPYLTARRFPGEALEAAPAEDEATW